MTSTATGGASAPPAEPAEATASYELLVGRLRQSGIELHGATNELNAARSEIFATATLTLAETDRLSTDATAVARDVVAIGDLALFGYNVTTLRTGARTIGEVFALYRTAQRSDTDWDFAALGPDDPDWFLADEAFQRDFAEIYTYYSQARLLTLIIAGDRLLMVFGIGDTTADIRVLRWRIDGTQLTYLDAYGENDLATPDQFDFAWTEVGRESVVDGRAPRVDIGGEVYLSVHGNRAEFRIDDAVEGGKLILSEELTAATQDITEIKLAFARIGDLLLVRMLAYREPTERFYVYNRISRTIVRDDLVGVNARVLPGDQGVVFPGGYHLTNGESHTFALGGGDWQFHARHLAPNGEDVMYAYHDVAAGRYLLCGYNMVTKAMANPVAAAGYALYLDGVIVCLRETPDPARVHTISVYVSPFCTPESYAPPVPSDSFFGRIGNPELVAVLGECFAVARDVERVGFNAAIYEAFVARTRKLIDGHAWLTDPEARRIGELLADIRRTAGDILDEFAAVQGARKAAHDALAAAEADVSRFLSDAGSPINDTDTFIERLTVGRARQGALATLAEMRFADADAIAELAGRVKDAYETLAGRALEFLAGDDALASLVGGIADAVRTAETATASGPAKAALTAVETAGERIVVLTEVVGSLTADDAQLKTAVLEHLADALARRNAAVAAISAKVTDLRSTEDRSEFAAALAVLSQRAAAATMTSGDAASLDAALASLDAEVETLESRFGDVAEFSATLADKRDEIYGTLTTRRDQLTAERTRRLERIGASARRALDTVAARASTLGNREEFEGYFATDPLAAKVRAAIEELRGAGEGGAAGELTVAFDAVRASARRAAADRVALFDEDGSVRIGRHRFGVNQTSFDVHLDTADPKALKLRLNGTDLVRNVDDAVFGDLADAIAQAHPSETDTMSRSLYLAFEAHSAGITVDGPTDTTAVRALAQSRLADGFEIGVHDADAVRILDAVGRIWDSAGLVIDGAARAVAVDWHATHADESLTRRLAAVAVLGAGEARRQLLDEIGPQLDTLAAAAGLTVDVSQALDYLVSHHDDVQVSADAAELAETFRNWAADAGLDVDGADLGTYVRYVRDFASSTGRAVNASRAAEAAIVLRHPAAPAAGVGLHVEVSGLLATHPTIVGGNLTVELDAAWSAYVTYRRDHITRFATAATARRSYLESVRRELGVEDLRSKPLPSFVRNTLIDDVYLPLIGDNFAKQLGMAGAAQGLLMLISPPGYGKTTLVEYVANLLGFALVKVNGPALGDKVTSLDPAAAPDAAASAELVKLNRAFAMGTNVICYLDDIQHTSPELLSRFIPLCDATRRIDGVFDGEARTWELAGKRFIMVMAGNPYTSDGTQFRLPDMLTNRADVYNLGDVVGGRADAFARSYIEVAAGANATLAPVVASAREDLDTFLASIGATLDTNALSRAYPTAEVTNVTGVLGHLMRVRDVLLAVNGAYIHSANVDTTMRGEPPFLLQGSYRNMAKIAAKIVGQMTDAEVDAVIADHYRAEAQTLGAAASWNLAKLAEVRGQTSEEATVLRERWSTDRAAANPVVQVREGLDAVADAVRDLRG